MYLKIHFSCTLFLFIQVVVNTKTEYRGVKVFITVSALASGSLISPINQRNIIINYYDLDCKIKNLSEQYIGLYSHDPNENVSGHLALYKPDTCPEGQIKTNFSLPFFSFTKENLTQSICLGYWAAFIVSGKVMHSNCISTHPNWMYNMRSSISNLCLNCLMIPGTHNSGCYSRFDPMRNTVYEKYLYTQEETVFNQLVHGIRYLDLRIWHRGSRLWNSKVTITHDQYHFGLPRLEDVLQQVKDFVEATNEIVVVDFHRKLTGLLVVTPMRNWQHIEVINLVKSVFGNLLIDRQFQFVPLKKLWEMNKRVLVTYASIDEWYLDYLVSPQVQHLWIDTDNITELHQYLNANACVDRNGLSAAGAFLTPNTWMPFFDIKYSRRVASEEVNIFLNKWFRNELSCSSIVLTDYFLSNDIINIAIEVNKHNHRC